MNRIKDFHSEIHLSHYKLSNLNNFGKNLINIFTHF